MRLRYEEHPPKPRCHPAGTKHCPSIPTCNDGTHRMTCANVNDALFPTMQTAQRSNVMPDGPFHRLDGLTWTETPSYIYQDNKDPGTVHISANMPLTEQQRNAVPGLRAYFSKALYPSGIAESVDDRARQPDQGHVPPDVTVRIEIAPPSSDPHPLLVNSAPLRSPERVPIYFFSLGNGQADTQVADTGVIFFLHGGGNVVGHPTNVQFIQFFTEILRAVASRAGNANKWVLVAPSYRVASVPENAFPAALQDIVAAYDYVLGKGYAPSNIVIAGDSAGGNHAVVLTHLVSQSDRVSPHGVIAIAPFANLMADQLSKKADDDVIDPSMGEVVVKAYLGDSGVSRTSALVSGVFIPFGGSWPKTLLLVGTADQMVDGSREIAKQLTDINRPVELVEYDERPHAWWVLPQIFSEDIRDAVRRIAHFVCV